MHLLENFVDQLDEVVLITEADPDDPADSAISFVNAAFERMTGYERAEVVGKTPRFLQGPKTERRELDRIRKALHEAEPVKATLTNYKKSGEEFRVEMQIVPLTDERGSVTHFAALQRDVTRRELEAESLKESEETLRLLVNNLPGIVFVVTEDGELLHWNRQMEELLGSPAGGIRSLRAYDGIAPRDREQAKAHFTEALDRGFAREDLRFRCPSGRERVYLVSTSRIRYRGQCCLLGLGLDVQAQREAEDRVREQAALLDNAKDAIVVLDPSYRIVFWNRGAERLYGWRNSEMEGKRLTEVISNGDKTLRAAMAGVVENGEWSGVLDQRSRDGRALAVESSWTLSRAAADQPRRILTINTDITERRSLEQQLYRAQRLESIGTLAGGIAHDLNNILGPIIMTVDLLRYQVTDPKIGESLETMARCTQRGAELVNQILSFARGLEGEKTRISLQREFAEIEKLVAETFPKNIEFSHAVEPGLWPVMAESTHIHQVLLNLCVNARDAMPEGGQLRLRARNFFVDEIFASTHLEAQMGQYVLMEIEDSGEGMTSEVAARVFDPFFTTKEMGRGSGLGLSTCRSIVKGHGGFLNVYSELGKGTRVAVYLPAGDEAAVNVLPCSDLGEELPRGRGELILIVDDEPSMLQVAESTLRYFNYQTLTARNGAEAVAIYGKRGDAISVVVMDMMMPIMDGSSAIQAIAHIDPEARVIAVSGISRSAQTAYAGSSIVKGMLSKPFNGSKLLTELARVLDPAR